VVQVQLAYTYESVLAEVGGILGMLLGVSVLTLCESFTLFHDFLVYLSAWIRSRKCCHDVPNPEQTNGAGPIGPQPVLDKLQQVELKTKSQSTKNSNQQIGRKKNIKNEML